MKTFILFFIILGMKCEIGVTTTCENHFNKTSEDFSQTNESCTFIITRDSSSQTMLIVNQVTLQGNDSLVIYDGNIPNNSSQIVNYSAGSKAGFQIVVGFQENVTIVFTRSNNTKSTWSVHYDTTECYVPVENIWISRLDSPLYVSTPSRILNCKYNVTSRALPPDHKAVVSMSIFNLTGSSNLTVSSGTNSITYKNNSSQDDFFVEDTNTFGIEVNIANASTLQMFSLIVHTVMAECSRNVTLKTPIEWKQLPTQSVGYECRWLFRTTNINSAIIANISSLNIASNSDRLSFIDGASSNGQVLATVTTDVKNYVVTSSAKSMIVSLMLGSKEQPRSIDLTVTDSVYWSRFTGEKQLGFQNKTDNVSMYYQLIANQDVVNVQVFSDLPEGSSVTFYSGLQLSDAKLIVLSDNSQDLKNIIGGANMLVELSGFKTGSSFDASFISVKQGCNLLVTSASGQVSYPEQNNKSCTLTIAPQNVLGSTIIMNIDFLQLGENESLSVYPGLANKTPIAIFSGPYVTRMNPLQIYVPVADKMSVVTTAAAVSTPKVVISYQTVFNACGALLKAPTDSILTPNYPNQYPLNAHCVWVPADIKDQFLYLSFQDIALVQNHTIAVVDSSNKSAPTVLALYGNSPHLPADMVFNKTTNIQIEFQSTQNLNGNINQVGRGVNITARTMGCGGTFYGSGSFHTHGYPEALNSSSFCMWIIDVKGKHIQNVTNIVNFTIDAHEPNLLDQYLQIYDGDSIRSGLLNVNKTNKGGILSRYDTLVVELNYTWQTTIKNAGFRFNFTTKNCLANELCDNGVCLHIAWRCNGIDDCGDNTDEKDCSNTTSEPPKPPTTLPPSADTYSGWVKSGWVPACLFIGILLGAIFVFAVPKIIRRLRARGGNYSRMGDNTVNA